MAAVALRKNFAQQCPFGPQITGVNTLGQNGIAKSATFPTAMWLLCIYFVTSRSGYCDN
jgi:hypothetical protein